MSGMIEDSGKGGGKRSQVASARERPFQEHQWPALQEGVAAEGGGGRCLKQEEQSEAGVGIVLPGWWRLGWNSYLLVSAFA